MVYFLDKTVYRRNSLCTRKSKGLSWRIEKSAAGVVQTLRRPSAEIPALINLFSNGSDHTYARHSRDTVHHAVMRTNYCRIKFELDHYT